MAKKKNSFFKNNPLINTNEDNASAIIPTIEPEVIIEQKNNILDEFDDSEKKEIKQYEELVKFHANKVGEHLLVVSKALYEAQKLFARKKSGKFTEWYNALNLEKTYVYRLLQKYELFLTYQKKEVMHLPVRIVTTLATKREEFKEAEIIEIIEAEKPSEILKKIQKEKIIEHKIMKQLTTEENVKIGEIKDKIFSLKQQKEKLIFQIKAIEEQINSLKKEEENIKYTIK